MSEERRTKRAGMVERFMRGPVDLGQVRQSAIAEAAEPTIRAVPAEPEPATIDEYKDFENGRKRVVILLTEDGARIEPVQTFGGMTYAQAAAVVGQVAEIMRRDTLEAYVMLATENSELRQNTALLESKLPRPAGGPVPAPVMPNEVG